MQSAGRLRFLSKPSSKGALTEISNLAWGSNTRSRGRSFAALVPSPRKIRKWVSKDERQAMVKEFINKYRSGNSGKFPTASYIKKEVGGSYYFVRKILQEVEYKSKLSSSNTGNESSNKSKLSSCKPMLDIDGSKSKAEEHQPSSEYPSTKKLEDLKEETPYESLLDIDVSKSKAERHQSLLDLEMFAREDLTEKQMEKIPKKSSIWVNLKYFAEGIINVWRKR